MSEGFDAWGNPVQQHRKQQGYDFCRSLGLTADDAWGSVEAVASSIARDKPYEAQQAAMQRLDLTGSYRLMALLCTDQPTPTTPTGADANE